MSKEYPAQAKWEEPKHYEVATSIVNYAQEEISGTLGVLLTQAEMLLPEGDSRLKAYKDQIRREFSLMRNRIQDTVYFQLEVQDQQYTPGNVYLDRPAV